MNIETTIPSARPPKTSRSWPEPRFVDVGHSRLAYRCIGSGPDVVFVHGWPLHSATFRHIAPRLASEYTCHLFDLPGTGDTHWTDESPVGMVEHAETLLTAVDALGLSRYALVAHDSGGFMARVLAARDAARVAGLVLGNTELSHHVPWQVRVFAALGRMPFGEQLLVSMLRLGPIRRSSLGFGGCFRDPGFVDGEFFDLFVKPLLESRRMARGQMLLARNLDLSTAKQLPALHARITAPVRLVWGPDDPFFPIARARRMLDELAGSAELVEIPAAKLFAHEEFPEKFVEETRKLLRVCFRDGPTKPSS
jgi:pimeloyl-ACP methyl ester carboxylesterase